MKRRSIQGLMHKPRALLNPTMRKYFSEPLYFGNSRYIFRFMAMHVAESPAVEMDEVLKALSNPVRREILQLMRDPRQNFPGQEHPYEFGVCAGRIDACFGLSQSTISAHLAVLQHAGLITAKRVGQWIFYRRNEQAVVAFLQWIEKSL